MEEKTTYSIEELFHRLIQDESWEADPDLREKIVRTMFNQMNRVVPLK